MVIARLKDVARRGEVRQKILERFFSDTGALARGAWEKLRASFGVGSVRERHAMP